VGGTKNEVQIILAISNLRFIQILSQYLEWVLEVRSVLDAGINARSIIDFENKICNNVTGYIFP